MPQHWQKDNDETRAVWDANADFWDARMGEGNDFVEVLCWPALTRLLALQGGEKVLDIACGNGLTSRRLAAQGAEVVAFDFSERLIAHARVRTAPGAPIRYSVCDATDEAALLALGGEGQFDAALSNMALFDMAEIAPLFRALARLLKPEGCFVFSVLHPCFNNPHSALVAELEDRGGDLLTTFAAKVWGYLTPFTAHALAMRGQPRAQLVFHRPLQELLGIALAAGFVLDGLEERAFPVGHPVGPHPISWGRFSEIPPVLVARVRR